MNYSSASTSAASKRTNSFVNMNEYSAWAFEVIVLSCTVLIIKHQKKDYFNWFLGERKILQSNSSVQITFWNQNFNWFLGESIN